MTRPLAASTSILVALVLVLGGCTARYDKVMSLCDSLTEASISFMSRIESDFATSMADVEDRRSEAIESGFESDDFQQLINAVDQIQEDRDLYQGDERWRRLMLDFMQTGIACEDIRESL